MRLIVLAALLALLGSAAHAVPTPVDFATVSMSAPGVPRTVTNTVCATDGNDLVCDRGVYITPVGQIGVGTKDPSFSLHVTGNTDGGQNIYSSASNDTMSRFGLSNSLSHWTISNYGSSSGIFAGNLGIARENIGAVTMMIASETGFIGIGYDQPQARLHVGGPAGSGGLVVSSYQISLTQGAHIEWNRQNGDGSTWIVNHGGLGLGGIRFGEAISNTVVEWMIIHANGNVGIGTTGPLTALDVSGTIRLAHSGENCDGSRIGAVRFTGGDFSFCRNGSAWETLTSLAGGGGLGDRITSGTASGVVAMAGGTVSFTTGGTSGTAYLDTVGRFVGAGVSTTGAISATSIYAGASLQLTSPTAVTTCNSSAAGTIRYNSPTTTLELCTGSGWQPMGVGIPAGTISAFASTTCPVGWSEYTAARGRFLRGIDNGAGNDPSGTRAPGSTQADLLGSHAHDINDYRNGGTLNGSRLIRGNGPDVGTTFTNSTGGAETRPKNVAVTYCQFNGTSNGWNNPLSGGSTTAAGSTGQLQYNTGNAFDASAGLTWTNASSLLGVAGTVSTTSITVGGLTLQQIMASATTAQVDRITSGTSAVVVNSATGIVSITQLGAVASYVHPSLGYVGPGVSATGTVSGSKVATNAVKFSGTTGSCSTAADEGMFFYDTARRRLQVCSVRN